MKSFTACVCLLFFLAIHSNPLGAALPAESTPGDQSGEPWEDGVTEIKEYVKRMGDWSLSRKLSVKKGVTGFSVTVRDGGGTEMEVQTFVLIKGKPRIKEKLNSKSLSKYEYNEEGDWVQIQNFMAKGKEPYETHSREYDPKERKIILLLKEGEKETGKIVSVYDEDGEEISREALYPIGGKETLQSSTQREGNSKTLRKALCRVEPSEKKAHYIYTLKTLKFDDEGRVIEIRETEFTSNKDFALDFEIPADDAKPHSAAVTTKEYDASKEPVRVSREFLRYGNKKREDGLFSETTIEETYHRSGKQKSKKRISLVYEEEGKPKTEESETTEFSYERGKLKRKETLTSNSSDGASGLATEYFYK